MNKIPQDHSCGDLCTNHFTDITLYVQPIVDFTGKFFASEILSRLGCSQNCPEKYIESSCINFNREFDWNIIEKILTNFDIYIYQYKVIHINIFPFTLREDNFMDRLNLLLSQHNINSDSLSNIHFEIIENGYIKEENGTLPKIYQDIVYNLNNNIKSLQNLGIKVGLDDYPKGNSIVLLKYLEDLDFIKIDKQYLIDKKVNFLSEINVLIQNIKKLHYGAEIIIEGVEDSEYIHILNDLGGIDFYQGYAIGKPKEIGK